MRVLVPSCRGHDTGTREDEADENSGGRGRRGQGVADGAYWQ